MGIQVREAEGSIPVGHGTQLLTYIRGLIFPDTLLNALKVLIHLISQHYGYSPRFTDKEETQRRQVQGDMNFSFPVNSEVRSAATGVAVQDHLDRCSTWPWC